MFNKEKIERLEGRIELLENKERILRQDLENKRVFTRERIYDPFASVSIPSIPAIDLAELETMQQRILNYLNVRLETTPSKTELVMKEIQDKKVCVPKEDLKVKEIKLDKREDCKICPKCGGKKIQIMWNYENNTLEKYCECSYGWIEDCLLEDYVKKSK